MLYSQDQTWASEALERFLLKMTVMRERACTKIPYTTKNGKYDDNSTLAAEKSMGIGWWTNGFWAGMMWLLYHETKEERYAEIARFSEEQLDSCFDEFYDLSHDLGFVYQPTAVADYRLTGSQAGRRRGLHAACLLAGRFNPAGNFIRAWNDWGDGRDTTGRFRKPHRLLRSGNRNTSRLPGRSGLRRRFLVDPRPGVGHLWFCAELCSYRKDGVSRHSKADRPLLYFQYPGRWTDSHRLPRSGGTVL